MQGSPMSLDEGTQKGEALMGMKEDRFFASRRKAGQAGQAG